MGGEVTEKPAAKKKEAPRGSKLQDALMIVLGLFFLTNAIVTLSSLKHEDAADHEAHLKVSKEQFMSGGWKKTVSKLKDPLAEKKEAPVEVQQEPQVVVEVEKIADHHRLQCNDFGGPSEEDSKEMVYWSDIPSDTKYVSPMKLRHGSQPRYMTFEPDGGGWNNIRMAMETVVGLAVGMGRTLVMPPQKKMYLLGKDRGKQRTHFGFADFFPFDDMVKENAALDMITMTEFLEREAMTGHLRNRETGQVSFPPNNRTDWDGGDPKEYDTLREWLRTVAYVPHWNPGSCLAAFPASGDHKDVDDLKKMAVEIHKQKNYGDVYKDNPVPVDAPALDRMKENRAKRTELCVYDEEMQDSLAVHFVCAHALHLRLLVHFYAFLFLEDWKEDLWMKRFMRDHIRYTDEIQCAAARIVKEMREIARKRDPKGNPKGEFDTFHIRRGDFQFKDTRIPAEDILKNSENELQPNTTIFIATDERDKKFFDPLRARYDIHFLDDFKHLLQGVNTNYYGMIDQLIASRGRIFFGCWHSTFTGFINRIRGYVSQKYKLPGYEKGELPNSYFYAPKDKKFEMQKYTPLGGAFFNREFPTSWRDIDKGIGMLDTTIDG